MIKRYYVRSGQKSWTDPGPDLLRPRDNAVAQVLKVVPRLTQPYFTRKRKLDGTWWPWQEYRSRSKLKDGLSSALQTLDDEQVIQIANGKADPDHVVAAVRGAVIRVEDHSGATPEAEIVSALFAYHFPASQFAGIFVCKRVAGTSTWSNHAWGDAVDRTESGSVDNTVLYDWACRMSKEGLWQSVQVIGTADGAHEQEYRKTLIGWRASTVNTGGSHLWHTHVSIRFHTGTPPCA